MIEIAEALGVTTTMVAQHYFSSSQWGLPTEENYAKLQTCLNNGTHKYLRREYEDLRREYEDLRAEYEDLRRPFGVSADVPYADVWSFPTVQAYPGKHPCEKPLPLMAHIIRTSSNPGAGVLDCFAGSGSTGVACRQLSGRDFIGIEIERKWCEVARQRLSLPVQEALL